MRNFKNNMKNSKPNGKKKAKNSLMKISKIQSIELPLNKHGTINLKD